MQNTSVHLWPFFSEVSAVLNYFQPVCYKHVVWYYAGVNAPYVICSMAAKEEKKQTRGLQADGKHNLTPASCFDCKLLKKPRLTRTDEASPEVRADEALIKY